MKTILCGNPSCGGCPSIEEKENKGIIITDKDQKIAFTKEQAQELCEYLCNRKECTCCNCEKRTNPT